MLNFQSVALVSLACSFASIQCSPLTRSVIHLDNVHTHTINHDLTSSTLTTTKNAFAIILSSTSQSINPTDSCETYHELLSQFEINESLALTYTLASEVLSYSTSAEDEDALFDFLVFVDEGISRHQRRHLRQIGAKVHQIKAARPHTQSPGCPRKPLKCENIPATEDVIRSSNDIAISDYKNILLLDPHVSPTHRLATIFDDVTAEPMLSNHHLPEIHHDTDGYMTVAVNEVFGLPTCWAFQWIQYLIESVDQATSAMEPGDLFPRRDSIVLRKSPIDVLNHYAVTGEVLSAEFSTWEMCLT